MKLQVIVFLFAIVSLRINSFAQQVQWPFQNSNQQGRVTGSLGEFRGDPTEPRFHRGNDLKADDLAEENTDLSVYSINEGLILTRLVYYEDGTINPWSTRIQIGDVYYYHVMPSNDITSGTVRNATAGTYLGEMLTVGIEAHVHLQQNTRNFLENGLNPFTDNHTPVFVGTHLTENNGIELYRNGIRSTTQNHTNLRLDETVLIDDIERYIIYSKVDIAAHIKDEKTATSGEGDGGNISPYSLQWFLRNSVTNPPLTSDKIEFNTVTDRDNDQAEYFFHPSSSTEIGNYRSINIITSDPYEEDPNFMDQFLNLRLRAGQTENFELRSTHRDENLDAPLNDLADIKDERYWIEVRGCDVDSDDTNPDNCVWKEVYVLVDNFKPYIRKMEVKVAPADPFYARVYEAEWNWDNQNSWLDFQETGAAQAAPTDYLEFIIYTSEPLTTEGSLAPSIQLEGATTQPTFLPALSDDEKYVFRLAPGNYDEEGNDSGLKTITINAYDLAGNQITGFDHDEYQITEDELPIHQSEGTWSGRLSKPDTKFRLDIQGSICSPPGGRTANGGCETIIADFDHVPDNVDSKTIFFTDHSLPSESIVSWNWDFGDGNTSTLQNPTNSYQFTGDYPVTLTVSDGTEEDTRTEFISVTNDILIAAFSASATSGDTPLVVDFNSSGSQGNIQSWIWEVTPSSGVQFVSGTYQSEHPSIQFSETGQFEVTLTVDNGSTSHTSSPQTINVSAGNSGETEVDFYWEGNLYSGGAIQFFDDSFVKCIGSNTQYNWTVHETFPQTYIGRFPIISFTEIGAIDVQLCITDNCETTCTTKTLTVQDVSEANKDLHPLFTVIAGTEHEIGEEIEFVDNSYSSNGAQINYWTWWYELPLDFPLNQQHSGPNTYYETGRYSVNHTFDNPGKFLVRLWLHEDLGFQGKNYDKVVIIRRPTTFCEESTNINDKIYEYGSESMEISGELMIGNTGDVTAENESTVEFVSTRTRITKGHFHPGSKVHIKGEDCDVVRSTFEE